MNKPKNIILDIGNVLGHFCWEQVFTETMGLNGEEFEQLANCTVRGNLWAELDSGRISDEEAIAHCIELDPSQEANIREFFTHLGELVIDYEYSRTWIKNLKAAGYKVYILSNYGKTAFLNCRANGCLAFVDDVDGAVISYEVLKVKPERDIYECLLKKYNLIAEECLFFDDLQANVDGAIACGINAVRFTNYQEALEALKQFE